MSDEPARQPLIFDPGGGSALFGWLCRAPSAVGWAVAPALLAVAAVISLCQGTLVDGALSPWGQSRILLGLKTTCDVATRFPLLSDVGSILTAILIGFTVVCLKTQCRIVAGYFTLDVDRRWRWRKSMPPSNRLTRWAFGVAVDPCTPREALRVLLARHGVPRRSRDTIAVPLSLVTAVGVTIYQNVGLAFGPPKCIGRSGLPGQAWSTRAYDSWWASWHHPAGAVMYTVMIAIGVYIVLMQNVLALVLIRIILVSRSVADFVVDWLNIDGVYGWQPVRRLSRAMYLAIALRAMQLTVAITVLDVRNSYAVGLVAVSWSAFVGVYIVLPQAVFRTAFKLTRAARLDGLVCSYRIRRLNLLSPSVATATHLQEIDRVREARINPLSFAKWQSSGFFVVVLLPVALTALQIFL